MKQTDEKELDLLIAEALDREAMAEEICRNVQRELRHRHRRKVWRKWLRLALISFGVPFLLLLTIYAYYTVCQHVSVLQGLGILALLPPLVLVGAVGVLVTDFRQTSYS